MGCHNGLVHVAHVNLPFGSHHVSPPSGWGSSHGIKEHYAPALDEGKLDPEMFVTKMADLDKLSEY